MNTFVMSLLSAWVLAQPSFAEEVIRSPHTERIIRTVAAWPPKKLDLTRSGRAIQLRAISTPERKFYIGLAQRLTIDAPIERVSAVIEDFDAYPSFFPDLRSIHAVRDGQAWATDWVQKSPAFFIPDVRFSLSYWLDATPARRAYRYQLRSSTTLKANDGAIVLERGDGPAKTLFTEIDFFDADWGLAEKLFAARIWKDSVEGIAVSDEVIRLKAENPEWPGPRVLKTARKLVESMDLDAVIAAKVDADAILPMTAPPPAAQSPIKSPK